MVTRDMKLIAFDWDQTLWNSWDLHVKAAQKAAEALGEPIPDTKWIASTFSYPFARHMETIFPKQTREATKHYLKYYHSRVRKLGHLFEDIPETIATLREAGYQIALLSDKSQVHGTRELKSTGLEKIFNHVLFLNDGRPHKPDPEGLRMVMGALSMDAKDVLYVGDSYVDIQCAKRAGVTSAGALWGCVNPEAMLSECPDHVLHEVRDLLGAVSRP